MSDPTVRFVFSSPGRFLAIGCGLGLSPKAPGTVGTLGGFALAAALIGLPVWAWLSVLAFAFVGGCYICDEAGRALGVPDHGGIVWDEIVAFALVLMCVPVTPLFWGLAFLLFRIFDILKPWPISVADSRFKNGFGVMFDDLLAAVFAIAVLRGGIAAWQTMVP